MMHTEDRLAMRADAERVFALAADVERWPDILPHYRWVRVRARRADGSQQVEMACWRPFGPLRWPCWWVSEMRIDAATRTVNYRHTAGITAGMEVDWRVEPTATGADAVILHDWAGPRWPLIGALAARLVIGPVFVHGIARRTLAGLRRALEAADARA